MVIEFAPQATPVTSRPSHVPQVDENGRVLTSERLKEIEEAEEEALLYHSSG